MRASIIVLVAGLFSMVSSKNVYNLHSIQDTDRATNDKRDAKNVPHLENLKRSLDTDNGKRDAEPKNVINLQDLKVGVDDEENQKRDAKNTPNLDNLNNQFLQNSDRVTKRKNTFKISDFIHENKNEKRDAKNTFNIGKYAELSSGRRDGQDILDLPDDRRLQNDHVFTFNSADCYSNLLQSILPQLKSVSIFAGYIRDNKELNSRTESSDSNMLIISPTDDAIENKLSNLKPWEFPTSLNGAMTEQEQDIILQKNLQNYLNGHVVTDFQDKISIQDGNANKEKIVVTKLNSGELLEIKQELVSQTFSVRVAAAQQSEWVPVTTVRQVENGFIFVINDSLVKP